MYNMQYLDGPYVAFVASFKLERAFLAISQRDKVAEDLQAEAEAAEKAMQEQSALESGVSREEGKIDGKGCLQTKLPFRCWQ